MADPNHLEMLKTGRKAWNLWRMENPDIKPDLSNTNLKNASLRKMDLSEANLSNTDLCNADLAEAYLWGTLFTNARLAWANLEQADLSRAHLRYTNLRGANLKNTNLTQANLKHAILEDADLSGSQLFDANLSYANLKNANLTHVDMTQSYVFNADITSSEVTEETTEDIKLIDKKTLSLGKGGEKEDTPSTVAYLSEKILPYLKAISDLQRIIIRLNENPPAEVKIYSISLDQWVDVQVGGAERLLDVIQNVILPFRGRRVRKREKLDEMLTDAIRARDYAESRKFKAEVERKRAEIEDLEARQRTLDDTLHRELVTHVADKLLKAKKMTEETLSLFFRNAGPLIQFLADSDLADRK